MTTLKRHKNTKSHMDHVEKMQQQEEEEEAAAPVDYIADKVTLAKVLTTSFITA